MTAKDRTWWDALLRPRFFSPHGFQILAAGLTLAFLACHAAGLRAYTCVLCGTSPTGDVADRWSCGLGSLYMVFYYAFVLGAPTLILASFILRGLERVAGCRATGDPATQNAEAATGSPAGPCCEDAP